MRLHDRQNACGPVASAPAMSIPWFARRKPLSLRTNISWTVLGNTVYATAQWAMLMILAKLGSPEMVGQFALGLAVTAPLITLANLQARTILATDAKCEYSFGDYLGLRLVTTLLALTLIIGVALLGGYRLGTALVIIAVAIAKSFESISDVYFGLLQQHERMDRIAVSMVIKGLLSLVGLGLGVFVLGSVLWGAVGVAIAWALVLVGYDIPTSTSVLVTASPSFQGREQKGLRSPGSLGPTWDLEAMKKLAWLALPLGFTTMLVSLNANIPRYLVERYLGERELGIFAAMAYLMVAGSTLINAMGQSASPRLARYYARGDRVAFRTLLIKLGGIGALLGGLGVLVVALAGREILTLLYRAEYAQHLDVLVWLMVAGTLSFLTSFLGFGMTAARYFKIQVPLGVAVVCATALACGLLVSRNGLLGAAQGITISLLLNLIGALFINLHALRTLSSLNPAGAAR